MRLMTTILILFAAHCAHAATAVEVARSLVDAFNAQDADGMAQLVTEDFELYYFDAEGQAGLAIEGPEALRREMRGYFEAYPDVRSEVVQVVEGPVFVAFREQIVGGGSSLAVYEVQGGKVRRAWYYPAAPPESDD